MIYIFPRSATYKEHHFNWLIKIQNGISVFLVTKGESCRYLHIYLCFLKKISTCYHTGFCKVSQAQSLYSRFATGYAHA